MKFSDDGGFMHNESKTGNSKVRLGWQLSAVVCGLYFCFLLAGIAEPQLLATPLFAKGAVSLAMVFAIVIIVACAGLTGYYVLRTSTLQGLIIVFTAGAAFLSDAGSAHAAQGAPANDTAKLLFFAILLLSLGITYWAARRTRSTSDFYSAGGTITPLQNGLALAGDYLSASALLGLTAFIYTTGFDGVVYALGFVVGWPIVVFLVAERLRNLGKYTFADVVAYRLSRRPARIFAACSTLIVVTVYLLAQMVGAGQLIRLLFGLDYTLAVVIVGALMILYVTFGGMVATTWVQITKAVLLLGSACIVSFLTLAQFGFDFGALLGKAVSVDSRGSAILAPVAMVKDPVSGLSLGLALMFGTAGLPHVLMRFFTVKDGAAARRSVFWATLFVSAFALVAIVLGYGAIALISGDPSYVGSSGAVIGGGNMVVLHLAHAVGGEGLLGLISAVGFATILAVVAGLTLSAATSVSHDLYANVFRLGKTDDNREMFVSRVATVAIGVVAVALGIGFEQQNIAYMVGLAFGIAASANFPVLLLVMYWRGLTTRGAIAGGIVGLGGSLVLTILGPAIWIKVLGNAVAVFPYDPPTVFTMPLAFAVCWLVSVLDTSAQSSKDRLEFSSDGRADVDLPLADMPLLDVPR
ncbi:cation/acetate symporter ActP [Bradyrhizobium sp. LTSP885]|uniref:cation/acetate symporter ActP n=1 Tax=Bradyrhizobium sp. LTSP885 TaxID=1619232 RepID=UPI001FD9E08C|nr:cation/acetate symporter ActP [Bradyrhizobium sp. LTSP885]